jgi:DNA polymerase III sliding clamp (beta) subunit (PCNA family)
MNIDKTKLQAAILFSAVKDVRYYLNGVLFDKKGYIVATDGHRAIAINQAERICQDFIVPIELIQKALKVSSKDAETVELLLLDDGYVSIDGLKDKLIDGRYPDWQAVVPVSANQDNYVQSPARINPDYVLDAVKASRLIKNEGGKFKSPLLFKGLRPKGIDDMSWAEGCALLNDRCAVHFGAEFTIVLMPCKIGVK